MGKWKCFTFVILAKLVSAKARSRSDKRQNTKRKRSEIW